MLHRMGGTLLPRTAIAVGIGATIAMNVYGGLWDGGTGGAIVAALYPVALVVSLETLIWMMRRFGPPRFPVAEHWEQWFATVTLGSLAGITGIISYLHALTVLERTGSHDLVAHLGPFVPDQLILTGTLALMAAARLASKTKKPDPEPDRRKDRRKPPGRTAAAARAAEEKRIANLVRQLDAIPGDRTIASDYCGGNRRMARRVLDLVKATNGHAPDGTRP
jgi:hypothetical protein